MLLEATVLMLPEAVVFLNVLVQLWNDSVFSLPRCLVVRQISPLHQVPQRTVFQQPTQQNTTTFLQFSQYMYAITETDNQLTSGISLAKDYGI